MVDRKPNRQVRLDPDICRYVEECAYDWDCSLSAATNRLLRPSATGEPEVEPIAPMAKVAAKVPTRVPKGANPRVTAILRQNARR